MHRPHHPPHPSCITLPACAARRAGLAAAGVLLSLFVGAPCGAQGVMYGHEAEPALPMGYARPVTNSLVVRADVSGAGSAHRAHKGVGIDYAGSLRFDRVAVLADYYLWRQLRVTGGLMINQVLMASPDARVELRLAAPEVSSYLGLGFGNASSQELGWNVYGDLGLSLGKAVGANGSAQPTQSQPAAGDKLTQANGTPALRMHTAPALKLGASLKF